MTTPKDELYQEVKDEFDVQVDRRLSLDQLQDQQNRMRAERANPTPEKKVLVPKRVRNVITGNEFDYTALFKGNPDLQVIEWE